MGVGVKVAGGRKIDLMVTNFEGGARDSLYAREREREREREGEGPEYRFSISRVVVSAQQRRGRRKKEPTIKPGQLWEGRGESSIN